MKINKFKIVFFISLLFAVHACEDDILNREEKDVLPAANVLNTLEGIEAILYQVYLSGRSIHQNTEISLYKQCGTDLAANGTHMTDVSEAGMRGMNTYSGGFSAVSGQIENIWNANYSAIANCNLVIQASGNFPVSSTEEENALLKFKGDALTLRALSYLELVRRFENIPLAVPLPEGSSPVLEAPLVSSDEIYDLILSDLAEAVELLPTRAQTGSVAAPSKGLANILMAEALLDLGRTSEAAAAAEEVINDDSYSLQPLDVVFSLEGGKTGNENNEELVFSWTFDPAVPNQSQYTSVMYTPLYDRVAGIARTMEQGGRPWGRFSPTDYYWSLFDTDGDGDLLEEEDGRLHAWHKIAWVLDDPDNIIPESGKGAGELAIDGYIDLWCSNERECRYLEPSTTKHWEDGTYGRTTAEGEGYKNIIVYRYAHAFLLAAEAYVRDGNGSKAAEHLNVLRERAFGNSDHNFTSVDMETFLAEHARELGHEGHRWTLLKRLGMLLDRVRSYNPDGGPNIQNHQVRWPIPQTFIDLAGVEQNEGY